MTRRSIIGALAALLPLAWAGRLWGQACDDFSDIVPDAPGPIPSPLPDGLTQAEYLQIMRRIVLRAGPSTRLVRSAHRCIRRGRQQADTDLIRAGKLFLRELFGDPGDHELRHRLVNAGLLSPQEVDECFE